MATSSTVGTNDVGRVSGGKTTITASLTFTGKRNVLPSVPVEKNEQISITLPTEVYSAVMIQIDLEDGLRQCHRVGEAAGCGDFGRVAGHCGQDKHL